MVEDGTLRLRVERVEGCGLRIPGFTHGDYVALTNGLEDGRGSNATRSLKGSARAPTVCRGRAIRGSSSTCGVVSLRSALHAAKGLDKSKMEPGPL
jgi:hypothetical protein